MLKGNMLIAHGGGPTPNILALPRTFTTTAVHLCMKDPSQNSHTRDSAPAHPCGG